MPLSWFAVRQQQRRFPIVPVLTFVRRHGLLQQNIIAEDRYRMKGVHMRRLFILVSLCTLPTSFLFPQHYAWTVRTTGGVEYSSVHPDTIRNTRLSVSQEHGTVCWLPLDSIQSLTYDHDPAWITLMAIGGVIGAVGNNNIIDRDHTGGIDAAGAAFGAATGYLLSRLFAEAQEVIVLEGCSTGERIERVRKGVPKRTGRVLFIE